MMIELNLSNDICRIEVVRSGKRRSSVSLRYTAQNTFVLAVPADASEKWIRDFLYKKRSWIKKILTKATRYENAQSIVPGSSASTAYHKIIVTADNTLKFPRYKFVHDIAERATIFQIAPEFFNAEHQATLRENLEKYLLVQSMKIGTQELIERAQHWATLHQITVKEFFVKVQKSRLGYCTHDHRIMLNARLFFAPEKIRDYVIHHELAHTRHHNHSRQFWQFLEKIFPGAKETDKLLRDPTIYSMKVVCPEA